MGCVADAGSIRLPRYYQFSSRINKKESFEIRASNFTLWEPIRSIITPNLQIWELPNLNETKEIDMTQLIKTLQSVTTINVEKKGLTGTTIAVNVIGIIMIVMVICTVLYCYCRGVLCARRKGTEQKIYVPPANAPNKDGLEIEVAADSVKAKDPVSPSYNLTPSI